MLVTFLVFASFSLLLLMLLLWYLWPSSRVSTSVPGQSPSHRTLGNIPNITDAGGLPHYLQSLHQQHGMVASFWIGDYLAISLASPNLFKLVAEPSTFLYQSIVPLINNAEILEKRSSAGSMINSIMSNFSPFSNTWSENSNCKKNIEELIKELLSVLSNFGDDDQIPIHDYVTALVVKIVAAERGLEADELRSNFINLSVELNAFLDSDGDNVELLKLLLQRGEAFFKTTGEKNGPNIFGDILLISTLTTWSLYYLSRNKKLQKRINDKEDNLTPFLTEIIRVTGLIPLTARVLKQNVNILGHTIEQGTLVINSLSSIWWDCTHFPNPEEVNLERKNGSILDQINANAMSSSSLLTAQIIVLQFLKKFELKVADPDLIIRPKFNFISKPDCDVWLMLKKN